MASYYSKSYGPITIMNNQGNGPYVTFKITSYMCVVDDSDSYPWRVVIMNPCFSHKLTDSDFYATYTIKYSSSPILPTWTAQDRAGDKTSTKTTANTVYLYTNNLKDLLGYAPEAHSTVTISQKWTYSYEMFVLGVSANSFTKTYSKGLNILVPKVLGTGGSGSMSVGTPRYTGRSITIKGTYSGITAGNADYTIKLVVNGSVKATSGNKSTSGTLSTNWSTSSTGTYKAYIGLYDGSTLVRKLSETSFTVSTPPATVPTMGDVSNTTANSINTTRAKTLSASWNVSYGGYPSSTITYEWHCYSSVSGEISSGTTTSKSTSFSWNMPNQDTRENIYWKVRAKNSTGWSSYSQSGNVEVYWGYTEPAKISAGSVNPNRFQLLNGNTNITFTASANIGSWGDRPGTRTIEYALLKNGSVLKWFGRNTTSSTGSYPLNLTYSVPESDLNSTYTVNAYKRLNDTEYTAGSDARYPTTGDNHVQVGSITFYEVQGSITGSFSIEPSVIISGLSSTINYSWNYNKQSSEKVSLWIEVYNTSTGAITKTINLEQNITTSKSFNSSVTQILVDAQQAGAYEVRMKATVTELNGGTHTYTLSSTTPQVYNPPIAAFSLKNVSKPVPTDNANSTTAKQSTNITWNYSYQSQGVTITKVTITTNSSPYGREEYQVPFDASMSSYSNEYTRTSRGDFSLGTTVQSYATIYYQITGSTKTYSIQTGVVNISITPTRYIYYLTRVSYGEKQLNKIHPLVSNTDKISKKIFLS